MRITPYATMRLQPTCSDGIAAYWLANDCTACELYGLGPYSTIVSTKPGIIRGGASGNTTWIASAPSVTKTSTRADLAVLAERTDERPDEERDRADEVDGDVVAVEALDDRLVRQDQLLERRFELEAERPFEVQHPIGVLERVGGLVLGEEPHVLVQPEHDGEQDELAQEHAAVASLPEAGHQPALPLHAPACTPSTDPSMLVTRGRAQLGFASTRRRALPSAANDRTAQDGFLRNSALGVKNSGSRRRQTTHDGSRSVTSARTGVRR